MRGVGIVAAALLGACAHAAPPGAPSAPSKRPPRAQIHRFSVGALSAVALKDGDLHERNDGQTFGLGHSPAEVSALFGRDTATIDLSIQPLLVHDAERLFLFDTRRSLSISRDRHHRENGRGISFVPEADGPAEPPVSPRSF